MATPSIPYNGLNDAIPHLHHLQFPKFGFHGAITTTILASIAWKLAFRFLLSHLPPPPRRVLPQIHRILWGRVYRGRRAGQRRRGGRRPLLSGGNAASSPAQLRDRRDYTPLHCALVGRGPAPRAGPRRSGGAAMVARCGRQLWHALWPRSQEASVTGRAASGLAPLEVCGGWSYRSHFSLPSGSEAARGRRPSSLAAAPSSDRVGRENVRREGEGYTP